MEDRVMGVSPRKRFGHTYYVFRLHAYYGMRSRSWQMSIDEGCGDGNDLADGGNYRGRRVDVFCDFVDGIFDLLERGVGVFDLWLEGEQGGGVGIELGLVQFGDDVVDGFACALNEILGVDG